MRDFKPPLLPATEEVRRFFARFERAGNDGDVAASAAMFGDVFVASDPNRTSTVERSEYAAALTRRAEQFATIERSHTTLTAIAELPLDDTHVLVDTDWEMRLGASTDPPNTIELSSIYVLRRDREGLRIITYINRHGVAALIEQARSRRSAP